MLPVTLTINEPLMKVVYEDFFIKREYLNDISALQHKLLIEQLIEELRLLNLNLNATNAALNTLTATVTNHIATHCC